MSNSPFTAEQRKILTLTLVPLFMSLLSVSIVNVVLTAMQNDLRASETELQWVLTGYALAFGVLLVAAGRAGDVYGRGRLFVAGVVLFGLGSLISGLAPDPLIVNIARVVMGLGSGFLSPQIIGLIQQFFQGAHRGKAFGILGGVVGISVAIGPVLGGVFVGVFGDGWGWRAAFLVNVPICVYTIAMAKPWLPASAWRPVDASVTVTTAPIDVTGKPKADLDPVGTLLFALATLLVMLPFVERNVSPLIWLCLPAAGLTVLLWVLWERRYQLRGNTPMVDLALFRTRSFANGTLIISIFFMGSTSLWIILALYMQQGLGESALAAGLVGLPSAILSAITSPLVGPHVLRWGRPLVIAGLAMVVSGLVLTAFVVWAQQELGVSVWWLLATLGLVGAGTGVVVTPNQTLSLVDVPLSYAGAAGGVLQTGQRVGTSVGIAAITGVAFAVHGATGNWSTAFQVSLVAIIGLVFFALLLSLSLIHI